MESQFVERIKAENRKIQTKNEFELCYLRHQYFRKANYNPSKEEMKPYSKIASSLAKNTYFLYKRLFHIVGMEVEDVINVAHVHIVSFIGLFTLEGNSEKLEYFQKTFKEIHATEPDEKEILGKNQAHFTIFLKQRMQDLVRVCRQKAKNIKGLKVEGYSYFYGEQTPPQNLQDLFKDFDKLGYRKLDVAIYKAIKKKYKEKEMNFQVGTLYYLSVPLRVNNITLTDFSGAGLDPRDSIHNMSPDDIYLSTEDTKLWESRQEAFDGMSGTSKAKVLRNFINKNQLNAQFQEEIQYARTMLRRLEKKHE